MPQATTPFTPTIPIQVTIKPANPAVSAAIADNGTPTPKETMAKANGEPFLRAGAAGAGTTVGGSGGVEVVGTGKAD